MSMEEWKEYKIGDLGRIITGKTPKTSIKENYGGNIPFLTPSDDLSNKYAPDTNKKITELGLNEVKNCLLPPNSICVSCIGSDLGKVVMLKEYSVTNQQFNSIIPYEDFCPDFIYYLMTIVGKELNFIGKTSTAVPIINKSTFSKTEVVIPSLPTQQKIANILSSLDDKIEVNRRINEQLEELAQALFKSWFVDFEPFKDGEFVESELGMIPEGWKVDYISNIPHTIETGKRPKGGVGSIHEGIPSIGAENIKGLGYYDYSKTKFVTEEFANKMSKGEIKGYELLIYKDGGKPGYFIPNFSIFGEGFPFDKMFLNEHVFKLDFYNRGYNIFAYFYFQTDFIMSYLNAQGGKAAIPGINQKDVENIPILTIDNEYVKLFCDKVTPIVEKILINSKENSHLSTLRDTLLPKLMSGEIDVNEVEI